MREGNETIKAVAALGTIGIIGFLGYKYYSRKSEEETIKAQTNIIKSDAINSAQTLTPSIEAVKKLIAANPKLKTYSNVEYQNFASSLYEFFKQKNLGGLVTIFSKLKTNVDLMLVSIYYSVKVFKVDEFGTFEIKTYNLSQSINNLTNGDFRKQLQNLFKQRNITFNLF